MQQIDEVLKVKKKKSIQKQIHIERENTVEDCLCSHDRRTERERNQKDRDSTTIENRRQRDGIPWVYVAGWNRDERIKRERQKRQKKSERNRGKQPPAKK